MEQPGGVDINQGNVVGCVNIATGQKRIVVELYSFVSFQWPLLKQNIPGDDKKGAIYFGI